MSGLFLDANVPIYAAGRDHPLKGPCKEVLRLAARHPGAFSTDAEVLQEMLHRYLSLKRWPEGKRVVLDLAAMMRGRLLPVTAEDVVLACGLADRYGSRLAARDLLHAAVMLRTGSAKIVTADKDFDLLAPRGIKRLDPADIGAWRHEVENRSRPG